MNTMRDTAQGPFENVLVGPSLEDMVEASVIRAMGKVAKRKRADQGTGDIELGLVIKRYRESLGLSLRELATLSGISFGFVDKLEKGQRGASIATLVKLAEHLPSRFLLDYLAQFRELLVGQAHMRIETETADWYWELSMGKRYGDSP